jgi:hypothetical protein
LRTKFLFRGGECENPINYNLRKINKIPTRLNKGISSIVNGYNRVNASYFFFFGREFKTKRGGGIV